MITDNIGMTMKYPIFETKKYTMITKMQTMK